MDSTKPHRNPRNDKFKEERIRIAKREPWKTFCTDIVDTNEPSRLRKVMTKEAYIPNFI